MNQSGFYDINQIISIITNLISTERGYKGHDIEQLAAWLNKDAPKLADHAYKVKEYIKELQEYNGDIDRKLRQEELNHEYREVITT